MSEKILVAQLVKNYHRSKKNRRFSAMFTRERRCALSLTILGVHVIRPIKHSIGYLWWGISPHYKTFNDIRQPNFVVEWVTNIPASYSEGPRFKSVERPDILIEIFRDLPQSLQENFGLSLKITPRLLRTNSFAIHHSLITPSLDAISSSLSSSSSCSYQGLRHLLTRSGLTHPEVFSIIFLCSFCLVECSSFINLSNM
jgi:hypothetical protein